MSRVVVEIVAALRRSRHVEHGKLLAWVLSAWPGIAGYELQGAIAQVAPVRTDTQTRR